MRFTKLGPNRYELELGDVSVFFSCSTPVAMRRENGSFVRTNKYHSITTTGHVNLWLRQQSKGMGYDLKPENVPTVDQQELDNLILEY